MIGREQGQRVNVRPKKRRVKKKTKNRFIRLSAKPPCIKKKYTKINPCRGKNLEKNEYQ
jgi:hypothetical protein